MLGPGGGCRWPRPVIVLHDAWIVHMGSVQGGCSRGGGMGSHGSDYLLQVLALSTRGMLKPVLGLSDAYPKEAPQAPKALSP